LGRLPSVRVPPRPRAIGWELDRVLLALWVIREARDLAGVGVDAVQVVVLVPLLVAREHEGGIVRRPDVERAQRARRLAARELTDLARLPIEDVQLDAAALVPVERDLVAAMREDRVVERWQRPQLANVDVAPRRSGRRHEVPDGTR